MATVVYATFEDVVTEYEHDIPGTDRDRIERNIRKASARLDRIIPSLRYRLASGDVDPVLPNGLVVESVLRVYRNPSGAMSETLGPFITQNDRTQKSTADAVTFDLDLVHALLDPVPSVGDTFTVGIPCRQGAQEGLWDTGWYGGAGSGLWGL